MMKELSCQIGYICIHDDRQIEMQTLIRNNCEEVIDLDSPSYMSIQMINNTSTHIIESFINPYKHKSFSHPFFIDCIAFDCLLWNSIMNYT